MNTKKRPYFLWDYNLDENDIKQILCGENDVEKIWMMGRVLSNAHFKDVWKYLSLKEIVKYFPKIRIRPQIKENWRRALNIWGYPS